MFNFGQNSFYAFLIFLLVLIASIIVLIYLIPRNRRKIEALRRNPSVPKVQSDTQKAIAGLGKVITLFVIGSIYFFVGGMSIMLTDSCGISSDCSFIEYGLIGGWIWLVLSFIFLIKSIVTNVQPMFIFRPHFALGIYLASVALNSLLI